MTDHITRKDIIITTIVLVFAFVGTPLFFWGFSTYRLNTIEEKDVRPLIKRLIDRHDEQTNETARMIAGSVPDAWTASQEPYVRWQKWNEVTRQYTYPYGIQIKQSVDSACKALQADIAKETGNIGPSPGWFGASCSFIIKAREGYVEVGTDGLHQFNDEIDIDYMESLRSDGQLASFNIHRDERTFHVFAILQENPSVFLQLRLGLKDQ